MNKVFIKIINNFARPHKIPKKILNKLNYYFSYKKYNQNFFEEEQNKIFEHFGLNRQEGIKKLISIKKDLDFKLRNSGMSSEHEVIIVKWLFALGPDCDRRSARSERENWDTVVLK